MAYDLIAKKITPAVHSRGAGGSGIGAASVEDKLPRYLSFIGACIGSFLIGHTLASRECDLSSPRARARVTSKILEQERHDRGARRGKFSPIR